MYVQSTRPLEQVIKKFYDAYAFTVGAIPLFVYNNVDIFYRTRVALGIAWFGPTFLF